MENHCVYLWKQFFLERFQDYMHTCNYGNILQVIFLSCSSWDSHNQKIRNIVGGDHLYSLHRKQRQTDILTGWFILGVKDPLTDGSTDLLSRQFRKLKPFLSKKHSLEEKVNSSFRSNLCSLLLLTCKLQTYMWSTCTTSVSVFHIPLHFILSHTIRRLL